MEVKYNSDTYKIISRGHDYKKKMLMEILFQTILER